MELLRSWGLEEQARAAAMDVEWRALATPTLADAATGTPIEVGFPSREQSAVVSPTGPACLPQDDLERILEDHLATLPAARLERGVEITEVESRDDGVTARTRDGHTLHARYLVAADGIRSTVRAALGIPAHGPGQVGASVGILFRAPVWDVVGEHRHVIYFVGDEGMQAALPVGLPDRWMIGLGDREATDPLEAVRRLVGVPDLEPRIENVARITYGVELAERFRAGSAFLVGDAAHRLSPRGATGMNTAIRDGYDLGWKLAWVLRGWAGEELLDTYEAERRPVAEHNGVRGADPNGSVRGVDEELRVDLGGRIVHAWLPGETGRISTLDLLGDGLTLFTGPGDPPSWRTRRGSPPVTHRRLDAITARALGILGSASLLVRPDGVPAAA
jgi:2-polyprenyl-6-methoxyphenol hydroxylase-like FAD-dependent oxidoreductase